MTDKPNIAEVIGSYVQLRRVGRELTGLCPFHADKNPSFSVNEEKGVFHCFGCGASGDVIDFVRKLKGLSYPEALAELGMDTTRLNHRSYRSDALLVEARKLAAWADTMTRKTEYLLREIGQQIYLCSVARKQPITDKKLIQEHEADLIREWAILEDLASDLQNPDQVLSLYRQRENIERILADGIVEPWREWPELTEEYRDYLRSHLPEPTEQKEKIA